MAGHRARLSAARGAGQVGSEDADPAGRAEYDQHPYLWGGRIRHRLFWAGPAEPGRRRDAITARQRLTTASLGADKDVDPAELRAATWCSFRGTSGSWPTSAPSYTPADDGWQWRNRWPT